MRAHALRRDACHLLQAHRSTLSTWNTYALVLNHLGRMQEAQTQLEEAKEHCLRLHNDDGLDLALCFEVVEFMFTINIVTLVL